MDNTLCAAWFLWNVLRRPYVQLRLPVWALVREIWFVNKVNTSVQKILNVCIFLMVQQCAVVSKLYNLEGKGAMVSPDLLQNFFYISSGVFSPPASLFYFFVCNLLRQHGRLLCD